MKNFVFLAILILLSGFASAEFELVLPQENVELDDQFIVQTQTLPSPDFTVYSSGSTAACACASTIDYVFINNPYAYAQTFLLYSDSELLTLPSTRVVIEAGDTLAVPYQVLLGCDERSQEYTIFIEGAIETKQVTKNLEVNQCQNLQVTLPTQNIETGICQEFTSTFRIDNTGTFSENYVIQPLRQEQYTSVESQIVTIPAGSFADIAFNYQFACGMDESYILEYDIRSEKSKSRASVQQLVTVTDTYDFGVEITEPAGVCVGDQSYFEIIVENRNEFTDFFTIDVDGSGYLDVQYPTIEGKETRTLALAPNTKTSLGVFVNPTKDRQIGVDDISVVVTSRYARQTLGASTNVSIFECYTFDNVFLSSPGTTSTCGEQYVQKVIEVAHDGYGSPTVEFTSSSEYVSFQNKEVTFNGQETQNLTVIVQTPDNLTSRNTVTLFANFRNQTVDQQAFSLFTDTLANCYMLTPVKDTIKLYEDSEYFQVGIQHVGDISTTFDADLVDAPAYVSLLDEELGLMPGTRNSLLFAIDRDVLVEDALLYNNGSIIGLRGQTVVELANADPKVSNYEEIEIVFVDYPWYVKAYEWVCDLDTCLKVFFALVLLVVIFGIVGIIKTAHHNYFRSNNILLLICVIVFIVAAIWVWMTMGPPVNPYQPYDLETNSTTYLRMVQGTQETLVLDDFFFDPDGGLEEFGIASFIPDHLNFTVDNLTITLSPNKNFIGNTTISLFVIDEFDEGAVSPDITLEVLPKKEYSLGEIFLLLCYYINLIVLFVLLLVIYIAFSFRKWEKEKQLTIEEAQSKKEEKKEEKKVVKKVATKKAPKKTTKKPSTKSSKADTNLIAFTEKHEVATVLKKFGKRNTQANRDKLSKIGLDWKKDKDGKPKNRENFYAFVEKTNALKNLE